MNIITGKTGQVEAIVLALTTAANALKVDFLSILSNN
jgi:hypothetical protein